MSEIDPTGMRPVRVSAGEVSYPPGGRLGPRWQHDVQLVLVHSGSARITVDDETSFVLRPGSVALLLPDHREYFEFDSGEKTRHSWVQLGVADPVPDAVLEAPRSMSASAGLTELVRATVSALRAPAATTRELAAALAAAAIWRYVGDAEARADGPPDPVDLARRQLDLRLGDPELTLERVAAAAHVTPAHLVRRFRAQLGITPMAYLWQRRVAAGVDMLVSTGLPVGEIARRAGFRSVYHFSRRVKEGTGLPPTEVRRRGWSHSAASTEYPGE